jgi:hypothetical protein
VGQRKRCGKIRIHREGKHEEKELKEKERKE